MTIKISKALQATQGDPSYGAATLSSQFSTVDSNNSSGSSDISVSSDSSDSSNSNNRSEQKKNQQIIIFSNKFIHKKITKNTNKITREKNLKKNFYCNKNFTHQKKISPWFFSSPNNFFQLKKLELWQNSKT